MDIKPVKKARLSEQIVDQLFKIIIKGDLQPGDKLPSERELTRLFNVSRNSIREGIRILEMLGFLVSKIGDGTYIADMSSEIFEGYLNSHSQHGNSLIASDILETRLVIEPTIARYAALRRNEPQAKMLEGMINEMERSVVKGKRPAGHGMIFHITIAKASQNRVLEDVLSFLVDYTSRFLSKTYEADENIFPFRPPEMLAEHKGILKAIINQDPDKAEKLMYEHISRVKERVEGLVQKHNIGSKT